MSYFIASIDHNIIMEILTQYFQRNKSTVKRIFNENSKDKELPATKIFVFMQKIIGANYINFTKDGRQFFKVEDNQGFIQKIVQQHHRSTSSNKSKKFFLYRISYGYQQFISFLQYWINNDPAITIHDPLFQPPQPPPPSNTQPPPVPQTVSPIAVQAVKEKPEEIKIPAELRQSAIIDNQFLVQQQKKAMLIAAYQGEIKKTEELLLRASKTGEDENQYMKKIYQLRAKISQLSDGHKKRSMQKQPAPKESKRESPKSKTESAKNKKQINFKALFQFYAKQNHLTGVKASFQRIQHESQTINYQKLVHFLKQYDIFPEKSSAQKKLHNMYVRICSNTRDLHYHQFMQLLQKLPEILYQSPEISLEVKKDTMINKILSKNQKNKLLHNPFHSLQKQDFRIDTNNIKYEFKLKPLKGKLESQVTLQLESRKKIKQQTKLQVFKQKQQLQIKKLKKLMAIDPYHPLVVKNSQLLRQKSFSVMDESPIANLDNMQKFRDAHFDMKALFGISDSSQDPLKSMHRYDVDRRADMIEREQQVRMSNLMSGLIERSEAKLAKLGLSPRKRQVSSKLN